MAKLMHLRPMLDAKDLNATIAFYTEKLGFDLGATWSPPGEDPVWCFLRRDGVGIMFNKQHTHDDDDHDHGDDGHGHSHPHEPALTGAIYVNVDDVDSLAEELRPRGLSFEWGPENMDYGMREIAIRDVDGYLLIFGADLSG